MHLIHFVVDGSGIVETTLSVSFHVYGDNNINLMDPLTENYTVHLGH